MHKQIEYPKSVDLNPESGVSVNQMTNVKADRLPPMLRVDNLTHRVRLETDTLTILQGVSLEINRGESVAIVGRSGSGKTTLLGLLAGLDTPSDGTVELDGAMISQLSEDERAKLRAHRVGFVFNRSSCFRRCLRWKTSCYRWSWPGRSGRRPGAGAAGASRAGRTAQSQPAATVRWRATTGCNRKGVCLRSRHPVCG